MQATVKSLAVGLLDADLIPNSSVSDSSLGIAPRTSVRCALIAVWNFSMKAAARAGVKCALAPCSKKALCSYTLFTPVDIYTCALSPFLIARTSRRGFAKAKERSAEIFCIQPASPLEDREREGGGGGDKMKGVSSGNSFR